MKKIISSIVGWGVLLQIASADGGITGISEEKLRSGDIHTDDIPNILVNVINFGIYIAGSIAIIFIIIGAYKILFGSIQQDKTKGKDTIIMAIGGFTIATLAWFIINFIITNFR